jgi:hypothetical protein
MLTTNNHILKDYDFIVVIPVGPNETIDFALDTIDSVIHYTGPNRKIIIVDDTGGKKIGLALQSRVANLDIVNTPRNHGGQGGLYLTLSLGYLHAYKNYKFKVLLKLDTDALVTGERPEEDAMFFFAQHPKVGVIGLFGHGTKPNVDDGHWSKGQLIRESNLRRLRRDPILCLSLRRLLRKARANGFRLGDYIFGGSYFMSAECVRRLAENNLLYRSELGRSLLEEDHIFGLLSKSVGIELADFAAKDHLPMAMEWRGLPYAPEVIVAKKKKIIHSTRRWEDLGEAEIRRYFRDLRRIRQGANGLHQLP